MALRIVLTDPMDDVITFSNNPNNLMNLHELIDKDSSQCDRNKDASISMALAVLIYRRAPKLPTFEE